MGVHWPGTKSVKRLLISRVRSPKIDEARQMAISERRRTRQTFVQLIPHDVLCLIAEALENS